MENAVLNLSMSFLVLKNINTMILWNFERRSLKKLAKHRAHALSTRSEKNIVE